MVDNDAVNEEFANETSTPKSGMEKTGTSEKAFIDEWTKKIKAAKKKHEPAFKRMEKCERIVRLGTEDKAWAESGKYVVPILNRHINQAVAALYAKNPKAYATRKRRLMHTIWDGKKESLEAALRAIQSGMADPASMMMLEEVAAVSQYNDMLDKLAQTMTLCWDYYTGEQQFGFKQQLKTVVRRVKVNGVGYVKLNFQRVLEPRPEITAKISDITDKIALAERLASDMQEGDIDENSAEMETLKTNLADLQAQEMMLVREGPVFDFPKSREVIIDPACRHLKTLAGAEWIAHEFDMSRDRIKEVYGVDVNGEAKVYNKNGQLTSSDECESEVFKVWEVQHMKTQQFFTICDGYCSYLKKPEMPDVRIENFFTIFPLVFNECEDEDELYPPSDVWQSRHIQDEYNRSREGLREHRVANRPYYVTSKGSLEENDYKKLSERQAHEVISLMQLQAGQSVEQLLQRGPSAPIDPNQYEVEMHFTDLLRVIGVQEAQMGATSGATATESSIAQQAMSAGLADNVDDLDEMLTLLAKSTGQLMLMELSAETAKEIAGPGAVWPESPMTREEVAKDLTLDIRAGSSGRPNKAAELSNMERGMPFITMLPGINPEPLGRKYLGLLDIDMDEAIVDGLPSITAVNAMMTRGAGMGLGGRPDAQTQGGPNDPTAQGGYGMGAPAPQDNTQNGLPGYSEIQYNEAGRQV